MTGEGAKRFRKEASDQKQGFRKVSEERPNFDVFQIGSDSLGPFP